MVNPTRAYLRELRPGMYGVCQYWGDLYQAYGLKKFFVEGIFMGKKTWKKFSKKIL